MTTELTEHSTSCQTTSFHESQSQKSSDFMDRIANTSDFLKDGAEGEITNPNLQVQDLNRQPPSSILNDEAPLVIAGIKAAYERSNKAAYETLGRIYEASPRFPIGMSAHIELVRQVKARWGDALKMPVDEKPADRLFLDLLFGVENKRSQKSQWGVVLATADEQGIPHRSDALCDWLEEKGGISGVGNDRKAAVSKPKDDVAEMAMTLASITPGKITLPANLDLPKDYGQFAVVIVSLPANIDPASETPVSIIGVDFDPKAAETRIPMLHKRVMASIKRNNAAVIANEEKPYFDALNAYQATFRKLKKPRDTRLELNEYLDERVGEASDPGLYAYWERLKDDPMRRIRLRIGH